MITPRTKRLVIYVATLLAVVLLHEWRVTIRMAQARQAGGDNALQILANKQYQNEQAGNPLSLRELTNEVRKELKK